MTLAGFVLYAAGGLVCWIFPTSMTMMLVGQFITVVICTQNIIAEIYQTHIFDRRAEGVDQKIAVDNKHILVRENSLKLSSKRNPRLDPGCFCPLPF